MWRLDITAVLTASCSFTEFCFPRLSKLRRTQRLATGKNTSTLSSTPSVRPPQSKKRIPRNQQVAHPPLQTGRVRPPSHQQRSGLEKCLVRLLGKALTTQRYKSRKKEIFATFKLCSHLRQGQASCYEGSGRAPPLGPPPSVDHPTVPPPSQDERGKNQPSLKWQAFVSSRGFPHSSHFSPSEAKQQPAIKHESYYAPYCYSGSPQGIKSACTGELGSNLPLYEHCFPISTDDDDDDVLFWQVTNHTAAMCAAPSLTVRLI